MCRYAFGEAGLVSGRFRRCRVIVATCSARSSYSRDVFGEFGFVTGRV